MHARKSLCVIVFFILTLLMCAHASYAQFGQVFIMTVIFDAETKMPVGKARMVATRNNAISGRHAGFSDTNGRVRCASYAGDLNEVLKTPDFEIIVNKKGYKPFGGWVEMYSAKKDVKSVPFVGVISSTLYVFLPPVYLEKKDSDKNSYALKVDDFLKEFYAFKEVSVEPNVITKGEKVTLAGKVLTLPEGRLPHRFEVFSLVENKEYPLKLKEQKKKGDVWDREPDAYMAEVKIGRKPGIYPLIFTVEMGSPSIVYLSGEEHDVLVAKDAKQEEAAKLFVEAMNKLQQSDADGAIATFDKAIEISKDYAPLYFGKSVALDKKGDIKGATDEALKSLKLDSGFVRANWHLGQLYAKQNDVKNAEKYFNKVVGQISRYPFPYHMALGADFFKISAYSKARQEYEKASKRALSDMTSVYWMDICKNMDKVKGGRKDAKAWFNIAWDYDDLGMVDEAIDAYKKVIEINPKYEKGAAYNNLGLLYFTKKDDADAAIENYKKAIEVQPKDALYHSNLGLVYRKKDMLEEELQEFAQAAKLKKKDYEEQKEFSELRKTLRDNPNDEAANLKVADVYLEELEYEKAKPLYLKALELNSQSLDAMLGLGAVLLATGEEEEGLKLWEKSAALNANHPLLHANYAYYYEGIGDIEKALASFEKVIEAEKPQKQKKYTKDAQEKIKELKQVLVEEKKAQ